MKCRHCDSALTLTLIDLGSAPPSNAYLTDALLRAPEQWLPLRVLVCEQCWLAQTEDFTHADSLFAADYAYFSSVSTSWLDHCERYVDVMIQRFSLGSHSHVVEVASNDGYLLQYMRRHAIPCIGIEPTADTAAAAREKGLTIINAFFNQQLAEDLAAAGKQADLMIANNVLAHVPRINDFVAGFTALLKPEGVATFEFPHLQRLLDGNQFDTIYHEHFSYLSLTAVEQIFRNNGLQIFDVEILPTHGGSLRVFAQRAVGGIEVIQPRVAELLEEESSAGMTSVDYYLGFQAGAEQTKHALLTFLLQARREGKKVAAYGAAAKGNTLLNYAGVRPDLLPYVADRNLAKQGKYLPGSRIPIVTEEHLIAHRPDYVLILPWNLHAELSEQMNYLSEWGGRLVVAVPELRIL